MKHILSISLLIASCLPIQAEEDFVLYTFTKTDTIRDLAAQHLGGADYALELLAYNEISNPARVIPGTELFIPKAIRSKALASFERAQDRMVKAADAEAEKYARAKFIDARGQLEKARVARNKAIYDQTIALSDLAFRKAESAMNEANELAWLDQKPKISSVLGKVYLKQQPDANWIAATVNDSLARNASIKTEKAARAEILFADQSTIQVLENTEMQVLLCRVDRRNKKPRKTRLKVLMGNILGEITPRSDDDSRFDIDTGRASIAIRGTGLRVGTEQANGILTSRIALLHGKTDFTAGGKAVILLPETGTFSINGAPPPPPIRLPKAPEAQTPRVNAQLANQQPVMKWIQPKGPVAIAWHVEIAKDEKFNQLVQEDFVEQQSFTPGVLAEGKYFWRVSSIERNGLEGNAFAHQSFTITRNLDLKPIIAPPALKRGQQAIYRKGVRVHAEAAQADTSIVRLEAQVNGESFQALNAPRVFNESKDYEVLFRGIAADGTISSTERIAFTVDARPPKMVHAVTEAKNPREAATTQIIAVSASDISGVEALEYRIDRQAFKPYTQPVKLKLWADSSFEYRATDKLGNQDSKVLHFKGVKIGR